AGDVCNIGAAEYALQRGFLLLSKNKTAPPGRCDRSPDCVCREAMMSPHRELVRRPLEPVLALQHCARGEPLFAASITPEPHQLGRALHRAEHPIELLLAVAVPVHEPGKVARGERRL